jgi:lipopolysaccharide transport system permease protein
VHVIEPRRPGAAERLRELRTYRGLLRYFALRSLQKVTGRTILGNWWLFLRPACEVGTAVLIFAGVLNVRSSGPVPYLVMFIAGATCWRLFENCALWSTRSLELNRKLLGKVYFPRLLLPVASLAPAFVEFAFYLAFLAAAVAIASAIDGTLYLRADFGLLAAPVALAMGAMFALGIGLFTSVLGANARDVRFTLGYVLGFWYFLTPVIYPLEMVPANARWLAELNPMTPIVELFKWGLLDAGSVRPTGLVIASVLITCVWIGGLRFFSRYEAEAVDRL